MAERWGRARDVVLGVLLGVGIAGTAVTLNRAPNPEPLTLELPTPQPTQTIGPTPSPTVAPDVTVFISGAVAQPGVYHLPPGSRVVDALAAAGGPTADAATETLNQAITLQDGMQIHMPRQGEVAPPAPIVADTAPSESSAPAEPTGPIPLNTATAADLETLPGIGPALAQRIIDYRTQNGPFTTLDQLSEVRGIGDTILADLRPLLTLD